MSILETNKQFYDNMLLNPSPLFQFVGSAGKTINDAFKAPVDAVKKEKDKLEKKGFKGYVNEKKEQAEKAANVMSNAYKNLVEHPKETLEATGKSVVDKAKETAKKVKDNPAATAGNVVGELALGALGAGAGKVTEKVLNAGSKAVNAVEKGAKVASKGEKAVEKGVQKATSLEHSANTASKGITKVTPSKYPANAVVKNGTNFPEEKPVLKNMDDMKVVNTPKAQPNTESLVDINSLKKNPPSDVQPTINEQLYNLKNGDLRKAPSDVEQLYLEQYRKYPAEMFGANPTRSTNTRLITDWAEGLVGKEGYSNVLRGQLSRGLRRNSTNLPTMNMGGAVGRDFNRKVLSGIDPYGLYYQNPVYRRGSTVGFYEPFYDTINIANRRYAQAIYDYYGLKKPVGDIYPHEVTHKVIQNLEEEASKNPNNRTLSEKINEMRTLVGEPRDPLNQSEVLANAFPAALNPKYQSPVAPSYGTGKLNDIGVLRNAEDWWRKEIAPYALKREESLFKGSNLVAPQSNPDTSLSDYMKILDDEQYLRRMKDL